MKMQEKQNKRKNKKAQEEMVGFVLILVVIVVIGLALLFFLKPQPGEIKKDSLVSNLLYSMLSYTSSCHDKEVRDVIIMCSKDENCNGEKACDYLQGLLGDMLDETTKGEFEVGKQTRGYLLNISTAEDMTTGEILLIERGNLTGDMAGSFVPIHTITESISVRLRLYY